MCYVYIPSASAMVIVIVALLIMTLSGPLRLRVSISSPSRARLSARAIKTIHGSVSVDVITTSSVSRLKSGDRRNIVG